MPELPIIIKFNCHKSKDAVTSDGNRPSLEKNDQRHSTQQPAKREAKNQRPSDSNPRPHRKGFLSKQAECLLL